MLGYIRAWMPRRVTAEPFRCTCNGHSAERDNRKTDQLGNGPKVRETFPFMKTVLRALLVQ